MRTPQTQRRLLLPLGVLIARVGRRFFLSRRQQLHAQAVACARYGKRLFGAICYAKSDQFAETGSGLAHVGKVEK